MIRKTQFAGLFYHDKPDELRSYIQGVFSSDTKVNSSRNISPNTLAGTSASTSNILSDTVPNTLAGTSNTSGNKTQALMTMLPHAGHVYCGHVMAATLSQVALHSRCIILCPNHTGQGAHLGYWSEGVWESPLGNIPIDMKLSALFAKTPFISDTKCHEKEHSIEVILPFLQYLIPNLSILPISVSSLQGLAKAADILSEILQNNPVSLIVSSDMNHFDTEDENRRKDGLALTALANLDPQNLIDCVQQNKISMCGVLPATLALLSIKKLGATKMELVTYDTSASASGDHTQVVGYAGAYIY